MTDGIFFHADGRSRSAATPAEQVAAAWDGFVLTENPSEPADEQSADEKPDYRALQEAAKAAGISANQSAKDLQAALEAHEAETAADADQASASSGGDPITPPDTQDNAHTD